MGETGESGEIGEMKGMVRSSQLAKAKHGMHVGKKSGIKLNRRGKAGSGSVEVWKWWLRTKERFPDEKSDSHVLINRDCMRRPWDRMSEEG